MSRAQRPSDRRRVARGHVIALILSGTVVGCAADKSTVRHVQYEKQDAIRLSNGKVELTVVPATGRIMRFGYIGGPNVLWENPVAVETADLIGGWHNWGGDKVWLWPQDQWERQSGQGWPPTFDPQPYEVRVEGNRLIMTSPVLAGYNLRIVREIRLDETEAAVHVVSRLEPRSAALRAGVRPWTVTQIAVPETIEAELVDDAPEPVTADLPGQPPWPDSRRIGQVLDLKRPPEAKAKIGIEADRLTARYTGFIFSQQSLSAREGSFEPNERAQVYSDPDQSPVRPSHLPPYIEFEFVAPVGSNELNLTWRLTPPNRPNE